jgi:hypothetical protein
MENNKGGWCPYCNDLFCLEGYCDDCCIGRERVIQLQGKAREVFGVLKLAAEHRGNETLKELKSVR